MKNKCVLVLMLIFTVFFVACDSPKSIKSYKKSVDTFYDELLSINSLMNDVDYDSPLAVSTILEDMNRILNDFDTLRNLTPPSKYQDINILLNQGYDYLSKAIEYYKSSFENPSDTVLKENADAYYAGSMKCIRYAGCYLAGIDETQNEQNLPSLQ